MIEKIIRWSIEQRVLVLGVSLLLGLYSVFAIRQLPVDAIPDLSDVQVIVKTSFPGQAPQVVQDQVTYPLSNAMLAVPKAKTVRGFSFFGDSYLYIIFEEGTDIYWARSRVLEYLSQISSQLPAGVKSELGPDATGVGWVYQYALVDRSGNLDISELTTLQNWFLKFELQSLPGVAEVATVGGMVKQFQINVDPDKLRAFHLPLRHVREAVQRGNRETGASVIEMAEAEYMVRVSGYLKNIEDIENIPLGLSDKGIALQLKDVARVSLGPQKRRSVADLNGEGEVVGGVVVMRYGENAQTVIQSVQEKFVELKNTLPPSVDIVTVYDRSTLITNAVDNLFEKIIVELLIIAVVCAVFLMHFKSSLVILISLPFGVAVALVVMSLQGVNANIMSLGGIAIAIGAMVDGAIVMIENVHRRFTIGREKANASQTSSQEWVLVASACSEVGRPLFFSLIIVTVSFLPVFALQAQEGKLFSPLALTKTYAMAAAAGLAITLVPVLIGYLIKQNAIPKSENRLTVWLQNIYAPVLRNLLNSPKVILLIAFMVVIVSISLIPKMGKEFMPPLDEGDLLYMPTMQAAVSIDKAREVLQQTDKLIRTVPEVETVFGKVGRANTATDPAPLTMIETVVQLKPKKDWRPGTTSETIRRELESRVNLPGVSNAWVMPIKTRIDMLATGIKTPVGIKVSGPSLGTIQNIGIQLERLLNEVSGTASVYSERVEGGRYIDITLDRNKAARFGLNIDDVQSVMQTAVGGSDITEVIEQDKRFPVNLRYPQRYRDSHIALAKLPLVTEAGEHLLLSDIASIAITDGPPAIKSENGKLTGWVLVDIQDRDLASYIADAKQKIAAEMDMPIGYSLQWAGQYEYLERTSERLQIIVPVTLAIIVMLLYLNFRRFTETLIVLSGLPFALSGGILMIYFFNFNLSVAVAVGFIALAGLAVEIGVLMLTYLQTFFGVNDEHSLSGANSKEEVIKQLILGASQRVRPITMTVATVVLGLLPVMFDTGTGAEVMQRIAAPMIGGMITTILYALFILPLIYFLWFLQKARRFIQ